ncbi:MAG: SusC/RagA family TonB-linked outer membrane protein [Culturomica sp.]|jgi:TonB-linked SusC/RagA family outer membrane protein|nr:SusC/RagA family TonB-linked outer membrane protein [Culturomica sp.]
MKRIEEGISSIFLIFMLLVCGVLSPHSVSAQNKNVTLDMQNANLEQVIWEIQKQTAYVFMYGAKEVKAVTGLKLEVKNKPALEVLDLCLKNTSLTYTVQGSNVVIKTKEEQRAEPSGKVTLEGVVRDESGATLPGVTVMLKGTTTGTATDMEGRFVFETDRRPGMVLQFSFVGMEPREIAYNNQPSFDVTLKEVTESIGEVVVTGYQRIDRRLFTGSADVIKADDITSGGASDVSRALQGKSAGIQVQNVSGTFGAAPKMRVRGASSIYGDQKPLWVVDGIVLEDVVDVSADDLSSGDAATLISSAVAGLNPDDIESFQVLKDASATAMYGARAMNGVVVITTKRGTKGAVRVSYSGELTMRMKPSYRNYNIMNSQQQMMVYQDLEAKGWLDYASVLDGQQGGVYRKMYMALDEYDPVTGKFLLENTKAERDKFLQKYEMANTDWFDVLFKNSIQQNHSISLSGGSEKSNFFASISYFNDPGWSVGDNVTRYTANMNASFDINEYIRFNFLTSNSFRKQQAPGTVGRNTDAATGEVSRQFDLNPFSYALNTSRAMRPYDDNGNPEYYVMNYAPFSIINELKNNYINIDMLDSKFQGELEIKPMTGMDVKLLGAVRFVKSSREHKITENSNMAEAYRADDNQTIRDNNDFLYTDPEQLGLPPYSVLPQGGFYRRTDNRLLNYYVRAMSNYTRAVAERHMFNVSAGMEVRSTSRRETYGDGYGIQYDRGNEDFTDYHILKQLLERGGQYYGLSNNYDRFVAFFLTGGFSWDSKYTLNLTGRYDGSNRMGSSSSSRWLPTWNVSGAWHAHSEPFLQENPVISQMTLRATYGLTASMGPVSNAKAIFFNDIAYRPTQGEKENQITISQMENAGLTWEKQYEFNMGMDLGLWENRISLSADVYTRKMFDLIGILATSGIGGEPRKLANYAKMKSHGVEFTLNTKNIDREKYSWNTNLTFSYNTNEITSLTSASSVMQYLAFDGAPKAGNPVRGIYTIPFRGLNAEGLPTFLNHAGEVTVTGVNFQESQHTDFMQYMGSADPKFTGGFDNTFKYGPFRLSVFFSYQFGSKIWLDPAFSYRYYDNAATVKEMADRWMVPGDEYRTDIPVIASKWQHHEDAALRSAYNAYNYSSLRVAKGDFIRLKEIALNYDLPGEWLKTTGLSTVALRFSASNLALLYSDKKLKGQDPEFFRSGGVAMPVPTQFTLSMKVGF